jgi:hypothetical protein
MNMYENALFDNPDADVKPEGWYPPDLQGWMHEIADRLAHIEVQLARMMPLVEQAEKFVSMTPMQRIRAGLK